MILEILFVLFFGTLVLFALFEGVKNSLVHKQIDENRILETEKIHQQTLLKMQEHHILELERKLKEK